MSARNVRHARNDMHDKKKKNSSSSSNNGNHNNSNNHNNMLYLPSVIIKNTQIAAAYLLASR